MCSNVQRETGGEDNGRFLLINSRTYFGMEGQEGGLGGEGLPVEAVDEEEGEDGAVFVAQVGDGVEQRHVGASVYAGW